MQNFVNHAIGGVLMGVGGVLTKGCTVAGHHRHVNSRVGAQLTFLAIVAGTMKYQYWRMMQEE